jgi:hypothetical protein
LSIKKKKKKYLWWLLSYRKNIGAALKRIPNGFGTLNPELFNPDLQSGFGIYKSRGIGIGIPLGTTSNHILDL